jgi:hypothetical protein
VEQGQRWELLRVHCSNKQRWRHVRRERTRAANCRPIKVAVATWACHAATFRLWIGALHQRRAAGERITHVIVRSSADPENKDSSAVPGKA